MIPSVDVWIREIAIPPTPAWMPPIALQEMCELEERIAEFVSRCRSSDGWNWDRIAFMLIIYHVWRRRLPLSEDEIWGAIAAHGAPERWAQKAKRSLRDGLDLLILAAGRKPNKRKRVGQLSF